MVIFLGKVIVDKQGRKFKHVKTFRHERDAVDFTNKLEKSARSRRFRPIIERVSVTLLRDRWWKHSVFKVYVPVKGGR